MGTGKDLWSEIETRYNKHDSAGWASLFARDAILTDPTGRYKGPDAIQAYMESADEPFTEPMNETFLLIEEGDTFVAEWVWRATHTETGEAVEIPGLSVFLVRDGKVASERDYFDTAGVMSRLGFSPGT